MFSLQKQGVAWFFTAIMVFAAIVLGIAKGSSDPEPVQPDTGAAYVHDYADLLSTSAEKELTTLNEALIRNMGVVIGCVTTREGTTDIYKSALEWGDRMGLEDYDFLILVDATVQQYILVQGAGLVDLFTDADCDDYADRYMLDKLSSGDYDGAFLDLAYALTDWYEAHYVD